MLPSVGDIGVSGTPSLLGDIVDADVREDIGGGWSKSFDILPVGSSDRFSYEARVGTIRSFTATSRLHSPENGFVLYCVGS